eukprot:SAG31_NODE_2603_length_5399_cov_2.741887_4_plen_58_part_00
MYVRACACACACVSPLRWPNDRIEPWVVKERYREPPGVAAAVTPREDSMRSCEKRPA